jgi:hypothetical protein
MPRTSEKLTAIAVAVVAVGAFMAAAFGIGYLVGKLLL